MVRDRQQALDLVPEVLGPAVFAFVPDASRNRIGVQARANDARLPPPLAVFEEAAAILEVDVLENPEVVVLVPPQLIRFKRRQFFTL